MRKHRQPNIGQGVIAGSVRLPKHHQGFTIIEVVIVLAIASLILLIVFLAVPTLQRNSRNHQYKNEASRILAASQEFSNNNSLNFPSCSPSYPCLSSTANTDPDKILKLSNSKNITLLTLVDPTNAAALTPTLSNASMQVRARCGTVGGASVTPVTTNVAAKNLIVVYAIENADGTVNAQCVGV